MNLSDRSSQELLGTAASNAADPLKTTLDLSSWKIYTYLFVHNIHVDFCFGASINGVQIFSGGNFSKTLI